MLFTHLLSMIAAEGARQLQASASVIGCRPLLRHAERTQSRTTPCALVRCRNSIFIMHISHFHTTVINTAPHGVTASSRQTMQYTSSPS